MASSAVAGDVCFRATARLTSTADRGRNPAVHRLSVDAALGATTFFDWLYGSVENLIKDRENFYRSLRNRNSWWINTSRWTLGILGAAALLLTALAGIAAIADTQQAWLKPWQSRGLFWAFVIYAVMGAIALFERGTDLSGSYFRHLTITIAIRNLWNEFQLTMLKEYPALIKTAGTDETAARSRAIELARALCKDIDTLVATEQTEWRTEFIESLKARPQRTGWARSRPTLKRRWLR